MSMPLSSISWGEVVAGVVGGGGLTKLLDVVGGRKAREVKMLSDQLDRQDERLERFEKRLDECHENHAECEKNLMEVRQEIARLMQGPVAAYTPKAPRHE